MVAAFLRRPRQVWLRRALFQVHLWVGIIVCVYSLLIGVSGSVLVFEEELARIFRPGLMKASAPGGQQACLPHVVDAVRRAYPDRKIEAVYAPGVRGENYVAYLGETRSVFVDAVTGRILGHLDKGWLEWVEDLHFRLLAGRTGLIVNGIGAASLLVLCISGIVIWWPGVKTWKRALGVDFRRRWQRINFDLHSSIGFWVLAILSVWAVSGIYFVWPEAFPRRVRRRCGTLAEHPVYRSIFLSAGLWRGSLERGWKE